MIYKFARIFFSLLIVVAAAPALAMRPIILEDSFEAHPIGKHLQIFVDDSATMSIDDVVNTADSDWQQAVEDEPNYGYTRGSIYWAKFKFSATNTKDIYLEYITLMMRIDLYRVEDGTVVRHWHLTDDSKYKQKPLYRFPLFVLEDAGGNDPYQQANGQSLLPPSNQRHHCR